MSLMATIDFDFRNQIIQSDIGNTLAYCYQCATCSGACPVAQVTNGKYNPRRLIRAIEISQGEPLQSDNTVLPKNVAYQNIQIGLKLSLSELLALAFV